MRNHGSDLCVVQTHDSEVARQTLCPLGHHSPSFGLYSICMQYFYPFTIILYIFKQMSVYSNWVLYLFKYYSNIISNKLTDQISCAIFTFTVSFFFLSKSIECVEDKHFWYISSTWWSGFRPYTNNLPNPTTQSLLYFYRISSDTYTITNEDFPALLVEKDFWCPYRHNACTSGHWQEPPIFF